MFSDGFGERTTGLLITNTFCLEFRQNFALADTIPVKVLSLAIRFQGTVKLRLNIKELVY